MRNVARIKLAYLDRIEDLLVGSAAWNRSSRFFYHFASRLPLRPNREEDEDSRPKTCKSVWVKPRLVCRS